MARHFFISLTVAVLVGVTVVTLSEAGAFSALGDWWRARCVAEQLLKADGPTAPAWLRWAAVLISGLMLAWIGSSGGQVASKLAVGGASLLVWSFTSLTATVYGVFLDPFPALMAGCLAFLGGLGSTGTAASRRRQEWSGALGDRVSPETFAHIVAQPSGEKPLATVSELTAMTVRVTADWPTDPAKAPAFLASLQQVLKEAAAFLRRQPGAVLDLPSGEQVRVFFGWITPGVDAGAGEACRAALTLKSYLDGQIALAPFKDGPSIRFGIGVSTGRCLTGLHGTGEGQVTASGPPAEHSRQLAGAASRCGVAIAIGKRSCQAIGDLFVTRPLENGAFFALESVRSPEPEPQPEPEAEPEMGSDSEWVPAEAEPTPEPRRREEIVVPEAPLPPFPGPAPLEPPLPMPGHDPAVGDSAGERLFPDISAVPVPLEPVPDKARRNVDKGGKSKAPAKPRGKKGK